jgi:hypothetical protein
LIVVFSLKPSPSTARFFAEAEAEARCIIVLRRMPVYLEGCCSLAVRRCRADVYRVNV